MHAKLILLPFLDLFTVKLPSMSEFKRLKRLAKSLIPRFPRDEDRQYSLDDARNMINDLGLSLSPEALGYVIHDDKILDDFVNGIHNLENKLRRKVVNEQALINPDLDPKAYEEDQTVGFTVTYKGEEIVFAEYDLPE